MQDVGLLWRVSPPASLTAVHVSTAALTVFRMTSTRAPPWAAPSASCAATSAAMLEQSLIVTDFYFASCPIQFWVKPELDHTTG
jgi:hypothetical protein